MMAARTHDPNAAEHDLLTPERELQTLLIDRYGVSREQAEALDRTGLMRVADTFAFLANNLPPDSLKR